MNKFFCILALFGLSALSASVSAYDQSWKLHEGSPLALAGVVISTPDGGDALLTVTSQNEMNGLSGSYSSSASWCTVKDAPAYGTWDGQTLSLEVPACGRQAKWVIRLNSK